MFQVNLAEPYTRGPNKVEIEFHSEELRVNGRRAALRLLDKAFHKIHGDLTSSDRHQSDHHCDIWIVSDKEFTREMITKKPTDEEKFVIDANCTVFLFLGVVVQPLGKVL